ncbi:hypothetical protein ACFLX7_03350 [Chloroflexota bacterium]
MSRVQICPKCKGRVYVDRDEYGWFYECITCGYMHYLDKSVVTSRGDDKRRPVSGQAN